MSEKVITPIVGIIKLGVLVPELFRSPNDTQVPAVISWAFWQQSL